MALSILGDKTVIPTAESLRAVLAANYEIWNDVCEFVYGEYAAATEEWKHAGKNYGWGFRLKDKKRVIVYLVPQDGYLTLSLVYGEKATQEALASDVSEEIKEIINSAKVYAEGRGFRIEVQGNEIIDDVKKLIRIKLRN